MSNRKNTTIFILGIFAALCLLTALVLADSDPPYGVKEVTYITSSRANSTSNIPANLTNVNAGNITEITISAISTTKSWAGYYGNITGTITLENSVGNVFYNWTSIEPKGNIFASTNTSIDWSQIRCFDWVVGGTGQTFDQQTAEDWFGIPDDASDGLNDTYNNTGLDSELFVGTRNITEVSAAATATCHSTNVYRDGAKIQDDFENVLLTDGDRLVFMTVIENNQVNNDTDITGFDGVAHDFQMLVAENGQNGQEDTSTTYFFWAEIQ
jgi:hypothetical protein